MLIKISFCSLPKFIPVVFYSFLFSFCYKPVEYIRGPFISKKTLCGTYKKTWQVEQLTATYSEFDRQIGKWVDLYIIDVTDTTQYFEFFQNNTYVLSDSLFKLLELPKSAFWSTGNDDNHIKSILLDSNRLLDRFEEPFTVAKYTGASDYQDERLWLNYKFVHWTIGGDVTRYSFKLKPKK